MGGGVPRPEAGGRVAGLSGATCAPQATGAPRGSVLALFGATVVWGATFFLMKEGVADAATALGRPAPGFLEPLYFLVARFALALVLLVLLFPRVLRGWTRATWGHSLLLSLPFTAGFVLQVFGLRTTSPTISAFLTSLYVVFTPLLGGLWRRAWPGGRTWAAVGLAVAGLLALFAAGGRFEGFGAGEAYSAACAFAFAVHILLIDYSTRREDPFRLTLGMLFLASVALAAAIPFTEGGERLLAPETHAAIWSAGKFLRGVVLTASLGTVLALTIVSTCQKAVSPTHAGVIYTLEPAWAGLFSYLFFGEGFTAAKVIGGVLLLGANLVCARE